LQLLQGLLLVQFTRTTGVVEVGVEAVVGVGAEVGVEVGVGAVEDIVVVATLTDITHTLPTITRTILVTTVVTGTILTVPLRTLMDPIHTTTMVTVTQRIHQPSIS